MDTILCDELIQEVFRHLPPKSFSAVSLVSKKWLRLLRSSTTTLSLSFNSSTHRPTPLSLSTFLFHHPYLSTLSLTTTSTGDYSDQLLLSITTTCQKLRHLRFLVGPITLSPFSLLSLSTSCSHLSSLSLSLSRNLSLCWLNHFISLKNLSLFFTGESTQSHSDESQTLDSPLNLESLCLSGIRNGDFELNWLWRNCNKLKTLKLTSCGGVGDNVSFSGFIKSVKGLQEVELRSCRIIIDTVLSILAENCISLNSLLIYDGASKDSLLNFINQSKSFIKKLDFRLPLDLNNSHLIAMASNPNFQGLTSLRLKSSCLVTGEGLKKLAKATSHGDGIEELVLINCDVVERESGLLTSLGQSLKKLRKLDLSYNDLLINYEFISMIVSCNRLKEVKLRGCGRLSNGVMVAMAKICKELESVDVMDCCKITVEGIELFLVNSGKLNCLKVEESKLSSVTRK